MQYHKRLFIPGGRMPTHAVSGLQPYGPVSLPETPYVLKSLHFESLHEQPFRTNADSIFLPSRLFPTSLRSCKQRFLLSAISFWSFSDDIFGTDRFGRETLFEYKCPAPLC